MHQVRISTHRARKPRISQIILSGVAILSLGGCAAEAAGPEVATDLENKMTANNTEVIETIYDNFGKGDLDGVLSVMDEDVIWLHPGSKDDFPLAGAFNGHEGVREFFEIAVSQLDVLDQEVFAIVAEDDRVLALGREHMRVKATGKEYDTNWVHAYTLRDGKVVRFEEFIDTAQMKDAFAQN